VSDGAVAQARMGRTYAEPAGSRHKVGRMAFGRRPSHRLNQAFTVPRGPSCSTAPERRCAPAPARR